MRKYPLSRRQWLLSAAGAALGRGASDRPWNFVVVLIDDMGWTDLGCYGSTFYRTPNIDRLAAGGMRFTNAYSACTVCSPSRASLLTGQYPARLRVTDWIPGLTPPGVRMRIPEWNRHLPLEEVTIAELLKPRGYATASVGKWHLGGAEHAPEKQGFDRNVAGTELGWTTSFFSPYKIANLSDGPPGEYLTDRLTGEALKFLDETQGKPFFLYLPHFAVHTPIQAKADVADRYRGAAARPGQSHSYPEYAAMVESVDDSVGAVMKKLTAMSVADRTVVIFTSDNGGVIARPHITSNEPLRGEKGTHYEGGVRVPLIVHWPGAIQPGSVSAVPAMGIDIFPTIADIAGLPLPPKIDGLSLAPVLRGTGGVVRRALYWHYPHYNFHQNLAPLHPGGAMRKGSYKLIEHYEDGRLELYDLEKDPGERRDLAASMKERAAELQREFAAWRKSAGAQMPTPDSEGFNPAATETWMRERRLR